MINCPIFGKMKHSGCHFRTANGRFPVGKPQFDTPRFVRKVLLRKPNCEVIMKRVIIGLFAGVAMSVSAGPPENGEPLETKTARRAQETTLTLKEEKPNQTTAGGLTYSGIAVQVVKTDNALQLINPAAPAQYGSAEDNLIRDPVDGKPSGLKIFAVSF